MALVKCTECGNEISDKAPACPECGAPRLAHSSTPSQPFQSTTKQKRKTHPVTWVVFIVLVGVVFWSTIRSSHNAHQPPIPIAVQFRPAVLGQGLVLMFENRSSQAVTFVATLDRPATGVSKKWELYAGPKGSVNISYRDGWIGQHGDRVTLENGNYQTWNGLIP